jgi:uncharacterized RDD family membrane protein YckC
MSQYALGREPKAPFGAPLANWWPRVGALVLDSLVVIVPLFIVTAILLAVFQTHGTYSCYYVINQEFCGRPATTPGWLQLQDFVMWVAGPLCYFGFLQGHGRGQTLGYRASGIAVRDFNSGAAIGFWKALLRCLVRSLLYTFLVIPGLLSDLWPLWDDKHQTLADKAFNTVVIRVR